MQLLLRRRAGSLSDDEWNAFLTLQSHIEDFQSQQSKNDDNLTTWQTIQLMSQAALSYSGSQESLQFIQNMTARVRRTLSPTELISLIQPYHELQIPVNEKK